MGHLITSTTPSTGLNFSFIIHKIETTQLSWLWVSGTYNREESLPKVGVFFTIFFVVIETSDTVTYIFWSSLSSLQLYVHYEKMIFGDKQLLKGNYLVYKDTSFLSTSPFCNDQTQVGKQKLARLIESRKYLAKLISFTPQNGSGMFMFLECFTIEYECTKRIYITLT